MSIDLVGTENLPNLYIKEIAIDRRDHRSLVVSVLVYLKDLKDGDSRFQWYENDLLRRNMKLMIVSSTSLSFNSSMEGGNHSGAFTPKHLKYISGYNRSTVQHKLISIQNLTKESLSQEPEDLPGGDIYTFGYRCNFVVSSYKNYSIFAACVFDTEQFSVEENLDLSSNHINAFHGAVAGEKVFVDGAKQTTTNLFFNGETPWAGPVHRQGNRWMAGSKHSTLPHASLSLKQIPNTKIKDYRITYKRKPVPKKTIKKSIFSNLYTSYNEKGNLNGSFHINMKQFFIQNTKYGNLLLQLNEDLFNLMLSNVRLNRIDVFRNAILSGRITSPSGTTKEVPRKTLNSKTIISTHDNSPYKMRTRYRYYNSSHGRGRDLYSKISVNKEGSEVLKASISEIHNSNSLVLRTITFSDMDVSIRTSGAYQYGVFLEFQDPTYKYVKEMLVDLKKGLTEFGLYKGKVERRINYDYHLNKTKESFANRQQDDNWINFVDTYLRFYDLLYDADETHMTTLAKQLIPLLNPRTATLKSLNRFFFHYQYLFNYFLKFFNATQGIFNEPSKRGSVKTDNDKGKIQFRYKWPEIHNFRKNKCRISFLPSNARLIEAKPENFPTLYRGEFLSMIRAEQNKYFKSRPSFTKEILPFLDAKALGALNNIEASSYTYFSPHRISIEKLNFDLSSLEIVDLFGFNSFFGRFINGGIPTKKQAFKSSRRSSEIINRTRSSFVIKTPNPMSKNDKKIKQEALLGDSILGKDSSFSKAEKPPTKIGNNTVKDKTKNAFKSFESAKETGVETRAKDFAIDGQESIITSIIKGKTYDPRAFEKIPQQVKSLFASQYGFGRSKILQSQVDLLASPLTRDYINLMYFTIVKLEYLSGYHTDKQGNVNFKNPIWKVMDYNAYRDNTDILFCRVSLYSDPLIKIQELNYNSFNIENQYFYLAGKGSLDTFSFVDTLSVGRAGLLRNIFDASETANEVPNEYTQSAIINQVNKKNGPLGFIDYGTHQAQLKQGNDFNKPILAAPSTDTSGGNY